ncbi:hypothetical protein [Candidatus Planktophila dulcis]|jgi:hypothetical protein
MNTEIKSERKKITAYQVFGWTPLAITAIGAGIVVFLSVLRDL